MLQCPVRRYINIPTSSHSGRPKFPQGRASWRWRGSLRENVGSLHLCNDQIPSGLQRPVNDLQHTSPTGCKLKETTPEFQAWQTKTVRAFRIKKNPAPLITPLSSFTGLDWWPILPQAWDGLVAQEKFKDMDYLIPRLSHSHDQLRPHGVDPSPWSTEVADKLGKDLTGDKTVPIDLDHKDSDTEVLELDPSPRETVRRSPDHHHPSPGARPWPRNKLPPQTHRQGVGRRSIGHRASRRLPRRGPPSEWSVPQKLVVQPGLWASIYSTRRGRRWVVAGNPRHLKLLT